MTRTGYFHHYRLLNPPSTDVQAYDIFPLMPPQCRVPQLLLHDYHREIAWSIDYRGDNDDLPTLLYVGAGYTLVKKVFLRMFGRHSVLFSGFRLYRDYYRYQRQRHAWVRIAVELRNFNDRVMSLQDFGELMARQFTQECLCNIKQLKLEKFLNV